MKTALMDWQVEDRLVFFKGRCYVSDNINLQRDIVKFYHNNRTAGHPGFNKTLDLVQRMYWWPRMYAFVNNYVKGCARCQQDKPNTHPLRPPLMPIPAPDSNRPFTQISMDFISDLPPAEENKEITGLLVIVDHGLTKGVILTPCRKNIDAEETAQIFLEKVFAKFGLSDVVFLDRGTQFMAKFFTKLFRLLGIDQRFSTAYHPQTDGQMG